MNRNHRWSAGQRTWRQLMARGKDDLDKLIDDWVKDIREGT